MTGRDDQQVRRPARRMAAVLALLIVVLLIGVAASVLVIVSHSQAEGNRHTLADSARTASVDDAPPGVYVTVETDGRLLMSPGMPDGLPDRAALAEVGRTGSQVERTVQAAEGQFLVRTTVEGDRVVQVALDQHENAEELGRVAWALAISGLVAVVAAGLIAEWMARRAMAPLAASLALQRRFIADASHELRTPLTLLRTRAQLLQLRLRERSDLDETVGAGVDEIAADAQALTDILEDLLLAADPREVVDDTPVDLTALAQETVRSHRAEADRRELRLEHAGATTPVTVRGSRVSLARLCSALVWNALDHARSGRHRYRCRDGARRGDPSERRRARVFARHRAAGVRAVRERSPDRRHARPSTALRPGTGAGRRSGAPARWRGARRPRSGHRRCGRHRAAPSPPLTGSKDPGRFAAHHERSSSRTPGRGHDMVSPATGRRRATATTAAIGLTSIAVTAVTATALWSTSALADSGDLGTESSVSSSTVPGTSSGDSETGTSPVTPGLDSAPHAQSSGS